MPNHPTDDTPHKEKRLHERMAPKKTGLSVELVSLAEDRKPRKGQLVNMSAGGMALWFSEPLPAGSHWLLKMPDLKASVAVKVLRSHAAFGGHVHGFKFSADQPALVKRLTTSPDKRTLKSAKRK